MSEATKHPADVQERAVRLVLEHERLRELGREVHESTRADLIVEADPAVFEAEFDPRPKR
jgi:hypothetical protein